MKRFQVYLFSGLAWVSILSLSACSVDMFDHKKSDRQIENQKPYRVPQPACGALRLESSVLTEKNFRDLVDCFNENHSIEELADLVHEASSAQLKPMLGWINQSFLNEKTRLYQSRITLVDLEKTDKLDLIVAQIGSLLKNPEQVRKLFDKVGQLKEITSKLDSTDKKRLISYLEKIQNEDVIASIRLLKKITGSPSFAQLRTNWRDRPFNAQARRKMNSDLNRVIGLPHGRELLLALGKNSNPAVFQTFFNEVSQTRLLLDVLLQNEGAVWQKLTQLCDVFSSSISCLGGEKVFTDPWQDLKTELKIHAKTSEELFQFSTRFGISATLGLAKNFCQIPSDFFESYPTYLQVATSNAGPHFLKVLKPLIDSDLISPLRTWASGSDRAISDLLLDLDQQGVLTDSLLVVSLFNESDRDLLSRAAAHFSEQSVDGKIDGVQWLDRIFSFDPETLVQSLAGMESFYVANHAHPWIDGIREAMIQVLLGQQDLLSMGDLSKLKRFPQATDLLYRMSQDGRLSSIMVGVFNLMAHHAEEGKSPTDFSPIDLPLDVPPHWLTSSDLQLFKPELPAASTSDSMRACLQIDLRKRISVQESVYFACLENTQDEPEAREATRDMTRLVSQIQLSDGRSIGQLLEDWGNHPPRGLIERLKVPLAQGGVTELAEALTPFFSGSQSSHRWIGEMAEWIKDTRQQMPRDWETLLRGFVPVLRDERLPKIIDQWVRKEKSPPPGFDIPRITRWIRNKECLTADTDVDSRQQTVMNDYVHAVSGWEIINGSQRQSWETEELKKRLEPALLRVIQPDVSSAVVRLLHRFSKNPKRVVEWFSSRSGDMQLLSSFYPGEEFPHVRLVSTLDRFEILLKSANFKYIFPDNYALKFMRMIGESWGDEPKSAWPESVRRRYELGGRPPTLNETFLEIKKTLRRYEKMGALPRLKKCDQVANPNDDLETQRRETEDPGTWISAPGFVAPQWVKDNVFNLHQTLSVIEENLPGSGSPAEGGMTVLRDIFFELSETPEGLPLILDLNEVSFLRSLSLYFNQNRTPVWLSFQADLLGRGEWTQSVFSLFRLTLGDADLRNHFSNMWEALQGVFQASKSGRELPGLSSWNDPIFYQWLSQRFEARSGGSASDMEMLLQVLEQKPESFRRVMYGACQGVKGTGVEEFLQILGRHL